MLAEVAQGSEAAQHALVEFWAMSDSKALNAQDSVIFGDVIYAYPRAQAIEDGVLVDVSETARKAGFNSNFQFRSSIQRKAHGGVFMGKARSAPLPQEQANPCPEGAPQ